jgi:hypothetical protein
MENTLAAHPAPEKRPLDSELKRGEKPVSASGHEIRSCLQSVPDRILILPLARSQLADEERRKHGNR